MYHIEGLTDLAVTRAQAHAAMVGDYRNKPESVMVHLHPAEEPCAKSGHEPYIVVPS
jgi:hypothetical protein